MIISLLGFILKVLFVFINLGEINAHIKIALYQHFIISDDIAI
jgi:hypothetical protein